MSKKRAYIKVKNEKGEYQEIEVISSANNVLMPDSDVTVADEITSLKDKVETNTDDINEIEKDLTSLIEKVDSNIDDDEERISEIENQMPILRNEFEELKTEVHEEMGHIKEDMEEVRDEVIIEMGIVHGELNITNERIDDNDETIEELVKNLETTNKTIRDNKKDADNKITNVNNNVIKNTDDIKVIKEVLSIDGDDNTKSQIFVNAEAIEQTKNELTSVKAQVEINIVDISDLKSQSATNMTNIKNLQDQVAINVDDISNLKEQVSVNVEDISEINSHLDIVDQEIDDIQEYMKLVECLPEIHFLTPADKDGDCTVIRTSENKWVMIDCGEYGSFDYTKAQLDSIGCDKIEMLFITHAHSGSLGEVVKIVKQYMPKKIIYKDIDWTKLSKKETTNAIGGGLGTVEYHNKMIDVANANGVELIVATDTIIPISPSENIQIFASDFIDYDDYNSCSLMFLYNYYKYKCLFTGGATFKTEEYVAGTIGPVDMIKMANYGLDTGGSITFLQEVQPKIAIGTDIKQYQKIGLKADNVARRYKYCGAKFYEAWKINPGLSFKIFRNGWFTSGIETKMNNTWYQVEGTENDGKLVYFKDDGEIAYNQFIRDNFSYYYFDKYYLKKSGWFFYKEDKYYADPKTGVLYYSKWVREIDENGDYRFYYLKRDGRMAKNELLFIYNVGVQFNEDGLATTGIPEWAESSNYEIGTDD